MPRPMPWFLFHFPMAWVEACHQYSSLSISVKVTHLERLIFHSYFQSEETKNNVQNQCYGDRA